MQVLVLAAFIVALTLGQLAAAQPALSLRAWTAGPAVATYLAGAVALGAFRTALSLRALAGRADVPPAVLRRHGLLTLAGNVWLIAGLAAVVLLGYGRWVLRDLHLEAIPLAGEAALLVPFVAALVLEWLLEYPFYREVRRRIAARQDAAAGARPAWTLGEYLEYNLRHNLLFVAVPVSLIVVVYDALFLLAPLLPQRLAEPTVLLASVAWSATVFVLVPLLIVRIWRTVRLPEGLTRQALLHACRQMRLRVRELLVWQTGGMIVNAGVIGLIAPVRYVLLTDGLLERMDRRQVLAVFAHEAGHILSHHLFYSVLFAVASVALCDFAGHAATALFGLGPWTAQGIMLGLLALAWLGGFGWISRRFERQSDVIGAWASDPAGPDAEGRISPEGAAVFATALQRIAEISGVPMRQRKWRHGSIASRVEFVLHLGATGGSRRGIDRVVARIKAVLWAAAGCAAALWAMRFAGWL